MTDPAARHPCVRFGYYEAGAVVWRRCLDCGHVTRGRWIRPAAPFYLHRPEGEQRHETEPTDPRPR